MTARSLRWRLLIAAAAFISTALVISAVILSLLFEQHVKAWIDGELNAQLDQLIAGVEKTPSGELTLSRTPKDPRFEKALSGLYWQVEFGSEPSALRSRSLWDFKLTLPREQRIDQESRHHRVAGPGGQELYLLQKRVELPARLGREQAYFAVALNEAEVQAAVWRFANALIPLLVTLGLMLSAAAWIQVSVGLRPLASIREKISSIKSGTQARLGSKFPDEVRPLASELDSLLDKRDEEIEAARTRAADLAHGLKTPLQIIFGGITRLKAKGEVELADDLETAARTMQRHVERQLARARLQGRRLDAVADVQTVAKQVANVLKRSPDGERLEWHVDVPANTLAKIHSDDLAEALGCLVENAARYARSQIAITAEKGIGGVTIRVSDDGPGIPEDKVPDALKRGERVDTSGAGSGLGLAIAKDIAEAWHGTLGFTRHRNTFSVELGLKSGTRLS